MTTNGDTLNALWGAEREMRREEMQPYLTNLFIYFASVEGNPTSRNAARKAMEIKDDKTLTKSFRVLEDMGFISQRPAGNNKIFVDLHKIHGSLNVRKLSLLLFSLNTTTSKGETIEDVTKAEAGGFSEAEIKMDADWRTVEPVLLKYFKPYQISPVKLTTKKRFEKLCELISDETFDFEAYCKWYRVEKYPQRKFNYGLFLYPDMIAEFRDSREDDDTYLKTTTRIQDSESFKKDVQKTKKFLKEIQEEMREKES